jgi:hypothetical protein
MLLSLSFLTCSKDTLFDPNGHKLSIPYAFVSPTLKSSITGPADSVGLATTDTVVKGNSLYFIGLISLLQNGLKTTWNFGDNQTSAQAITQHSFARSGKYVARFSIEDQVGDTSSDSVTIYAVSIPAVDSMVLPANADTAVSPDSVFFSWNNFPADPGDTIFSYLLLGTNASSLDTIVKKIRTRDLSFTGGLLPDTVYYWRIVVKTAFGQINSSAIDSFKTGKSVNSGNLTITNITPDTVIKINDSLRFYASVADSGGAITTYQWDFDNDGVYDVSGPFADSVGHRFLTEGVYNVVFEAVDNNKNVIKKTIKVTVSNGAPVIVFSTPDTIVDFGGSVRCSIAVNDSGKFLSFAIDTANTGVFVPMKQFGPSASFVFSTGSASSLDSVKMRAVDVSVDTIFARFKVSIKPRSLIISGIDSTDSTITVNWGQSNEANFQEYLLYRAATMAVDTTGTLVATITQASTVSYTIPVPTLASFPGYYRIYQRDNAGLLSPGSNIVFGNTMNAPPSKPVIVIPSKANDTLLSNATIRWKTCIDPNGDPVTYSVQLNIDSAGFKTIAIGISDTFYTLKNYDTLTFFATVRIVASDNKGASSATERLNCYFKQVRSERMRRIPAGTFSDNLGNSARISYDFFMDTIEVTQASYNGLMQAIPPIFSGPQLPVQNVTWYDAIMYCNALSKQMNLDTVYTYVSITSQGANSLNEDSTKNGFRLPTEDEWELAAKGGVGATFATNDGSISCNNANYLSCNNSTVNVGTYPANPYGIHELSGNISEWCWTLYETPDPGRINGRIDYAGGNSASVTANRIVRGGSYADNTSELISSARSYATANGRYATDLIDIGFRCVRIAP